MSESVASKGGGSSFAPIRPRSLRRNFVAALIGNAVYGGSQFGMLVAIAQLTSAGEVGRYALALAVTSPIFIFAGLKLRQVQVTDAAGINSPGDFFGLRLATSAVALVAVALVTILGPFSAATIWTLQAVALNKAFEGQIDVHYGAMQRREQLQLVARLQVLRGIGGLAVFVGSLAVWHAVEVSATFFAAFTAVQVLTSARRVRRLGVSPRPLFLSDVLLRLVRLAFPLGVTMVVASLIVNAPRYFLQAKLGAQELGIFSVLAYSLVASGTIANALVESAMPRLSNLYVAGEGARFKSILWKLMVLGACLGVAGAVVAALVGAPVLRAVFGAEYAKESGVLVLLAAAATMQYTAVFLGTSVNAMRLFTVQLPINVASLVAAVLVSWWALPESGLAGAGLAVIAGEFVQAISYGLVLVRAVLPRLSTVEPSGTARRSGGTGRVST